MRIESTSESVTVRLEPTRTPSGAAAAGPSFREIAGEGARALLAGVADVASGWPGGSVVGAALRRGATALRGESPPVDASPADGSTAGWPGGAGDTQLQYLQLQQRMQDENLRFTTLSNVLKARHETAKTAIGNIR